MCLIVSEPWTKLGAAALGQAGMLYDVLTSPADIIASADAIWGGCEFMTFPSAALGMQASHVPAADSKKRVC